MHVPVANLHVLAEGLLTCVRGLVHRMNPRGPRCFHSVATRKPLGLLPPEVVFEDSRFHVSFKGKQETANLLRSKSLY